MIDDGSNHCAASEGSYHENDYRRSTLDTKAACEGQTAPVSHNVK